MSLFSRNGGAVPIIRATRNTLGLYALIVLIVEGTLIGSTVAMDPSVDRTLLLSGALGLLALIVVIAGWRYTNPGEQVPHEIASIWTEDDIPITEDVRSCWRGRWNCRWTYRTPTGNLKPYVDDIIKIDEIDLNSGKFRGTGSSSYIPGETYNIYGRISKRGVAHLFYSTPPPMLGLNGMVILRLSPMGKITGWWLGVGRKGGDVGGDVNWEPSVTNDSFEIKTYPVEGRAEESSF